MEEKVFFKNSKGIKLCGILSNPTGSKEKSIIILCHGFRSSKESHTYVELQKILNRHNISTFRFDFFGHGESEGKFEDITISEAVDDILNAIAFLKQQEYSRIGLVGSSFGGISSIMAASKTKDIFVLALKSPVSDYEEVKQLSLGEKGIKEWKEKGYIHYTDHTGKKLKLNYTFFADIKNNNGYKAAEKISIPTFIIHGDADDKVPLHQSKKTAALMKNCHLEIIRGLDHFYSRKGDFEKMLELISVFIIKHS